MSRSRTVEIDREQPNTDLVRDVFDDVLRPAFPPNELGTYEALAESCIEGTGGMVVLVDADDTILGAAVDHRFRRSRTGLLAYLAVAPGTRDRGVGSELMTALRTRWERQPVDTVLAEVEDPDLVAETPENRTRARLRFYERQGAHVLAVPWTQPGLAGGARVPGFLLLRCWHRASEDGVLRSEDLGNWADEYYAEEEGAVPVDAEYRALRSALTRTDPVPILPISERGSA